MNTQNKVVAGMAAVALVVAGGFVYLRNGEKVELVGDAASASETSRPAERAPISVARAGRLGERAVLDGADSFSELNARLASAKVDAPQRARYLLTAAQLCEGFRNKQGLQANDLAKGGASLEQYGRYAAKFCKDFSGSSAEFERELLSYQDSDVVIARELAAEVNRGLTRGALLKGQEIVLTSDNPSAIYDAASALASQTGSQSWGLGQQLPTNARERDALPQAQWLASQMLACDLSGGCGAGGLTTMIECASYSICQPGITATEVFRKTSTPVQYDLALRVYQQLAQDRQTAKGLKS